MRLWRCYNQKCSDSPHKPGHDFSADGPKCDRCGTDGTLPKFAHLIVPLKIVHFDPPSHVDDIGLGFIACQPTEPIGKYRATGDPGSVNCPACRVTEAWEKANKSMTFHAEDDMGLVLDLAKQMVSKKG